MSEISDPRCTGNYLAMSFLSFASLGLLPLIFCVPRRGDAPPFGWICFFFCVPT